MFREMEPLGGTAGAIGSGAVVRNPDGTINFDADRERARRARTEAIKSSVAAAFSLIGSAFTA